MAESFPPPGYFLRIKNWNEHFERAQTRAIKGPLDWVAVPTRQDGLKFSRLFSTRNATSVFGVFILLVEIAARSSPRGTFWRQGDAPLTTDDFARMSGAQPRAILSAVKLLTSNEIGWLEVVACSEHSISVPSARSDMRERGEKIRGEEKRGEREGAREADGRGPTPTLDFSSSVSNGKSRPVEMVKEILGTVPIPILQERMVQEIHDFELWHETLVYWRNNKHNKNSHGLMLDRYDEQVEKRRQKTAADDPYAAVRERIRRESE